MAAGKLKRLLSMGLVCLMLTPIVSFATNDTAGDTQAEETNADDTAASDNKTTANTAAAPV